MPVRKIARQHPPLAARLQEIQQAAKNLIKIHGPRPCALAHALEQVMNMLELFSADVARIAFSHHAII